jgi:hypothetical protein
MLSAAALGGHEGTCHLAKKWGATDFEGMLQIAYRRGNDALARLAEEWIQQSSPV